MICAQFDRLQERTVKDDMRIHSEEYHRDSLQIIKLFNKGLRYGVIKRSV